MPETAGSDLEQGRVLEVSTIPTGDETTLDALTGDMVLYLNDASDFSEEGGQLTIEDVVYDYTTKDDDTDSVTLAAALTADVPMDTKVFIYPASDEKWAMVEVSMDDEPVFARVPHFLVDRVEDLVRDPADGESVILEMQGTDWVITDIIGKVPMTDGSYLDPTTVPTDPAVSDALGKLQSQVDTNSEQIGNNQTSLENLDVTTHQIDDKATTADGRISISDYEPLPEDGLTRNDGSLWFTRTRARNNLLSNPSFESNTNDWTTSGATMAPTAVTGAVDGTQGLQITNDTSANPHYAEWNNGAAKLAVSPGQVLTGSMYSQLVSGSGVGCYCQIEFYDGTNASLGTFGGTPLSATTTDWARLWVSATAPDTAASMMFRVVNPNAGDVWIIDGGVLENSEVLGRYFDGDSYDASWTGTPNNSVSTMVGGKIVKIFELTDNSWVEKVLTGDVLKDIDASQILRNYMDGERIADNSISIDKLRGTPVTAGEALSAGNLVNIYSDTGLFRARKASAANGRDAHGFILDDAALGAMVYVYSSGYNPLLSGLTPGAQFLSTVAGGVTSNPPSDSGTTVQRVGFAAGDIVLNFHPSSSVYIS